ncbi:MAG: cupin domain-containing protein [Rivularia sp. (in: cyanobacteria)]
MTANFSTHKETASILSNPEIIVNPVTGDRMTILHPSKIRFDLPPGAKGSPLHYHTEMHETFTVLKGCLEMEVGQKRNRRSLQPGESLHVPAGMHHSFRNNSDNWVTFTTENHPAIGFERFIRGMYGLAIDGKVNPEGIPTNLLQFALLLKLSDTIPVGIPAFLFSSIINALVWLAGVLKVERSLLQYWR